MTPSTADFDHWDPGEPPPPRPGGETARTPKHPTSRAPLPAPAARGDGLETPIQFVKGVGPRYAGLLEKLGIHTVEGLIHHFPHRYEDRRHFRPLGQIAPGETAVASGRIVVAGLERSKRRHLTLVKAVIQDRSGQAELVFFNQPWLKTVFDRLRGKDVSIYGTAQRGMSGIQFQAPEWEELAAGEDGALHVHRIVPIHSVTEGITPKVLRNILWQALDRYAHLVDDVMPPSVARAKALPELVWSLRQIHFPETPEKLEDARRRLVFDELFRLQAALALRKHTLGATLPGIPHDLADGPMEDLRQSLSFALTGAQERCIAEVRADMGAPHPMNRLLQGDVGSGKTVVAAAAIVTAVRGGYQVAMMVPTEILAEQHYTVLKRLLDPLGIRLHRLVGSVRARGKRTIKEELATGFAHAVVGTHALLEEDVQFHKLGLVIVDEQHRFGVVQRLSLLDKGMIEHAPDTLVMTATPIPRTLALTVYGDLDVSVIDEMPPNRKPVKTHWKEKHQRESVFKGIRHLVQQGRQVYFVCPLVEASEKLQARAATEVHNHLRSEVFPDLRVGLIHGQMPSHEKDEAMERFRDGHYDILVATVVIEVGVDVANASSIVIEDAERFGLAQLHQLRGRVGRGEHQSYCVLLADPKTEDGQRRLEVMVRTTNGFEIADEDLKLRGPGEFYGTKQSGLLKLRIANIVGDGAILQEARTAAFGLVASDPELDAPEHHPLRDHLRRHYADLVLASVA